MLDKTAGVSQTLGHEPEASETWEVRQCRPLPGTHAGWLSTPTQAAGRRKDYLAQATLGDP